MWASQTFSASVRAIADLFRLVRPSDDLGVEISESGMQYQYMDNDSGVGVLDKAVRLLDALEDGPATLAELVEQTKLPRATAHRLAVALEVHRLVARLADGRFRLGDRLAASPDRLVAAAGPVLADLRDETGESAQCYV